MSAFGPESKLSPLDDNTHFKEESEPAGNRDFSRHEFLLDIFRNI